MPSAASTNPCSARCHSLRRCARTLVTALRRTAAAAWRRSTNACDSTTGTVSAAAATADAGALPDAAALRERSTARSERHALMRSIDCAPATMAVMLRALFADNCGLDAPPDPPPPPNAEGEARGERSGASSFVKNEYMRGGKSNR